MFKDLVLFRLRFESDSKEFANANRVVIKQLSNLSFVGIDNASECIYTSPVQDSVWEYAEEVRACPIMLQERINKIADIRVTVVGTEIFPAKIASKSDDPNVVDFRARTEEHIDVVAIPDRLMAAVTSMTRRMGLQYAAFDFGLTPEGDYVFFEANVAGNWLWIEQATGLPISKSLADHLYGLAES